MKKVVSVLLVISMFVLFTGCQSRSIFSLAKSVDTIVKIEIVNAPDGKEIEFSNYENITSLVVIESDDWKEFWMNFYRIPCYRYFGDPSQWIEGNVVRITYENGDFELIGPVNGMIAQEKRGYRCWYTGYYFDKKTFEQFIDLYISAEDDVPKLTLPHRLLAGNE